jgi:transcriptional regulator of acetoin/glycerol metabolism
MGKVEVRMKDKIRTRQLSIEKEMLMEALKSTGGNVSQAADSLGKQPSVIYRLISRHGLRDYITRLRYERDMGQA